MCQVCLNLQLSSLNFILKEESRDDQEILYLNVIKEFQALQVERDKLVLKSSPTVATSQSLVTVASLTRERDVEVAKLTAEIKRLNDDTSKLKLQHLDKIQSLTTQHAQQLRAQLNSQQSHLHNLHEQQSLHLVEHEKKVTEREQTLLLQFQLKERTFQDQLLKQAQIQSQANQEPLVKEQQLNQQQLNQQHLKEQQLDQQQEGLLLLTKQKHLKHRENEILLKENQLISNYRQFQSMEEERNAELKAQETQWRSKEQELNVREEEFAHNKELFAQKQHQSEPKVEIMNSPLLITSTAASSELNESNRQPLLATDLQLPSPTSDSSISSLNDAAHSTDAFVENDNNGKVQPSDLAPATLLSASPNHPHAQRSFATKGSQLISSESQLQPPPNSSFPQPLPNSSGHLTHAKLESDRLHLLHQTQVADLQGQILSLEHLNEQLQMEAETIPL